MLKTILFFLTLPAVFCCCRSSQFNDLFFEGKNYKLLDEQLTWKEGQARCILLRGVLARIPNDRVNKKLAQHFQTRE